MWFVLLCLWEAKWLILAIFALLTIAAPRRRGRY